MSECEANLAPRQARKDGAGGTRQRLFSSCPRGTMQLADPGGILIDVAE